MNTKNPVNNIKNTDNYFFDKIISVNKPSIFEKKTNKLVAKPIKYISSDTGETKHFTPATQEWHNSIYAYNNNYIKLLPTADKNLLNLLKSFFNLQLRDKRNGERNRYKLLSTNRVFIGRGYLKHTSSKVVITFFVYNKQKRILQLQKEKIFKNLLYPSTELEKYIFSDRKGNQIVSYNRSLSIYELKIWSNLYELYYSYSINIVNKSTSYLNTIIKYYETLAKLVETKILTENEKSLVFISLVNNMHNTKYPDFNLFILGVIHRYKETLRKFRYLIYLNKIKFKKGFMWKLSSLVQNIYNKQIEFNIVNLKKMHLSSDIFTQAVSLKLRNRDNKPFKVLRSSLSKIKLPNVRKVSKDTRPNIDKYLINKIRNNRVNSMFVYNNNEKDHLNNLLLNFYPSANNSKVNNNKNLLPVVRTSMSLEHYVLKFLKHNKLAGIRVEAKGRLTRRFTASRSVFRMKWKGGLKNVNSSFRGLSTIMLRGYVKSNVQYSISNSKNRNGAFGVKGWIANK